MCGGDGVEVADDWILNSADYFAYEVGLRVLDGCGGTSNCGRKLCVDFRVCELREKAIDHCVLGWLFVTGDGIGDCLDGVVSVVLWLPKLRYFAFERLAIIHCWISGNDRRRRNPHCIEQPFVFFLAHFGLAIFAGLLKQRGKAFQSSPERIR